MKPEINPARLCAAAIVVLALWIVHDLFQALLAAGVIAVASWPLYTACRDCWPRALGRSGGAAAFTFAITVFVLAPLVFACWALVGETQALLQALAAGSVDGAAMPSWLPETPVVGPWLSVHWQQLAGAGTLPAPQADAGALLDWAQRLGRFTFRHALTVAFTILLLAYFYQEGAALARQIEEALRRAVGEVAGRYVAVATRAVRASVNGLLVVGLFDGLASALVYALAGAPRPLLWAAITAALAALPFLGYAAVGALALQQALTGRATPALLVLLLGSAVMLAGDKLVRPLVVREGLRLPFVWVLMGCIGGFEVLGLTGLVIGPVVLSVARELWARGHAAGDPA